MLMTSFLENPAQQGIGITIAQHEIKFRHSTPALKHPNHKILN